MVGMKLLQCDYKLAFKVEKFLIASHPNAEFIRVKAEGEKGLVSQVEEGGVLINVTSEVVEYVNSLLAELADST